MVHRNWRAAPTTNLLHTHTAYRPQTALKWPAVHQDRRCAHLHHSKHFLRCNSRSVARQSGGGGTCQCVLVHLVVQYKLGSLEQLHPRDKWNNSIRPMPLDGRDSSITCVNGNVAVQPHCQSPTLLTENGLVQRQLQI